MFKWVFLLVALILSSSSLFSVDCNIHKIYCQIVRNKPDIDEDYAMELSNIIYTITKKYDIDSRIYTAILAQESMYNLEALNCVTGLKYTEAEGLYYFKNSTVCTDIGISQIHYSTIKKYNFDAEKLTTNLTYSVEAGIKVLSKFKKKYGDKEKDYWTRYNSSNESQREKYRNLVSRYF